MTLPLLMNLGFGLSDTGVTPPAASTAHYPGWQAPMLHYSMHLLFWWLLSR